MPSGKATDGLTKSARVAPEDDESVEAEEAAVVEAEPPRLTCVWISKASGREADATDEVCEDCSETVVVESV